MSGAKVLAYVALFVVLMYVVDRREEGKPEWIAFTESVLFNSPMILAVAIWLLVRWLMNP
jgi:hypothetical protein